MSGATSASIAAGFKWGTSAASLTSTKTATAGSASFSATLSGLTPATTYYYQAYATVRGTEDHASETATFYGDVKSFITSSGAAIAASYSAVGVWIDHREHNDAYSNYVVSVDKIEEYTGFDFFAALPSSLQTVAEQNSSWNTFKNF